MALFTFQDSKPNTKKKKKQKEKEKDAHKHPPTSSSSSSSSSSSLSSWNQIKNLLHCKPTQAVIQPSAKAPVLENKNPTNTNVSSTYSCKSICRFGDVVHGNTRVVHRADNSPKDSSVGRDDDHSSGRKKITTGAGSTVVRNRSSLVQSVGCTTGGRSCGRPSGLQFRKLSGCYECHTVVDPSRYTLPHRTVCACSQCGEVFTKIESLEHHQAVRHAVSELGPDDSGRNIVEIIFKSSWMKKDAPLVNIERILKVHNTNRTIQSFEDCRDTIKNRTCSSSSSSSSSSTTKKHARCAADGNELLRFHCTTLLCKLGFHNSTNLCDNIPGCNICTLIRNGFQIQSTVNGGSGVFTASGSGRADDEVESNEKRRAMIVCRVVAGKVMKREAEDLVEECVGSSMSGNFDSVAGRVGIYSDLEELTVFNPRAILPCFVVIYTSI